MLSPRQIECWNKINRLVANMSAPSIKIESSNSEKLFQRMVALFTPITEKALNQGLNLNSLPKPAPAQNPEESKNTQPPLLKPKFTVVSLGAVDLQNEKVDTFFQNLTWLRHDPYSPANQESLLFQVEETTSDRISARRLFAYEIPWLGRNTESLGPELLDSLSVAPLRSDLGSLAQMATQQALHTASKKHKENLLVESYVGRNSNGIENITTFLSSLPWSAKLNRSKPQPTK
ncbi:MAG: hypothetical protein SH807_03665 [Blastochloris sp.]|nr:hypothetical protein [Blastochloris sp.]